MSMRYKGSRLSATANTPTSLTASGAWTLQQQMQANGTSTWPFVRDPQFNYVTMLLHGDGSAGANNGSGAAVTPTVTNFNADASTNNFNITINGDARSDNFNPYQSGYYSNSFNGSGSYLGVSAATIAATGQFCIEAWVYQSSRSTGTDQMIFSQYTGGVSGRFYLRFNVDKLSFTTSAGDNSGATTLNTNVWYHVAVTRDASNVVRLFVNGILDLSATVTQSLQVTTPQIGAAAASSFWNGYISNLRTVSGAIPTSYQTSSTTVGAVIFTPSTSPLTTASQGASGTSLLTCQSNRFIDNSASALTVTSTSTSVTPAIPFTLPSSVATYGSGYFDGTGDYLSVADSASLELGSSDFCIEGWYFPQSFSSNLALVSKRANTTSTGAVVIYANSGGGALTFYASTNGSSYFWSGTTVGTMVLNQWNHFAVYRSGNNWYGAMNGVVSSMGSSANGIYNNSEAWTIGGDTNGNYANGYIASSRIVIGSAVYGASNFTPPTSPLTAITNTQLLTTQYNGGGNNSGFKDSSQNNFVITRNGNTTQGTFAPYGPNWSYSGNGSNTYALAPNSTAFDQNAPFTLEWYDFLVSNGAAQAPFYVNTSGYLTVYRQSGGGYQLDRSGSGSLYLSSAYSWSAWHYIAISYDGTNTRMYVDGVLLYTYAGGGVACGTTPELGRGNGGINVNGYISNLRFTKSALYTGSTMTVPTSPLTAITNCTFLAFQSNRWIDNSTSNLTITPYNSPSVQRFSPFANATAYNPAVTGGSGYFDGSDYLTTPTTAAFAFNGNFTVEAWVYLTANIANSFGGYVTDFRGSSTNNFALGFIGAGGVTKMYAYIGVTPTDVTGSVTVAINAWNHVAYVRSGSTVTVYLNGVANGTLSTSYSQGSTSATICARYTGSTEYIQGYVSDLRVINGTALYTATFTPPTAPLTPTANTSLLLSNTNSAILDNAMMNDLETVGNAAVSTSVVKYGTASMYFDGTGDYLRPNSQLPFVFNTGDFTIEFWVYANSVSGWSTFFDNRPSTTGSGFFFGYNSGFQYYSGASNLISGGTLSTSTWTHVALCRASGSVRIFVNGTQVGSTATDTSNYSASTVLANGPFIGSNYVPSDFLNGYMDDFRVTKYARYTTTFTPPTAALPNG